jgi:hypothetical protein
VTEPSSEPEVAPEITYFGPGYALDKHEIQLTHLDIDLLIFAAGKVLGYVDSVSQQALGEGLEYGLTDDASARLDDLMNELLDWSEAHR